MTVEPKTDFIKARYLFKPRRKTINQATGLCYFVGCSTGPGYSLLGFNSIKVIYKTTHFSPVISAASLCLVYVYKQPHKPHKQPRTLKKVNFFWHYHNQAYFSFRTTIAGSKKPNKTTKQAFCFQLVLDSLFTGNEEQGASVQSSSYNSGLDVLAQAVQAASLQVEPKKPSQPRRKRISLQGKENLHDDNCQEPLKCTIRWEIAKIQRKRTYDRQHQENRTLKRKLGEKDVESESWKKQFNDVTEETRTLKKKLGEKEVESESWKKKFNDVTEENIRLNALLFVHRNQASSSQSQ